MKIKEFWKNQAVVLTLFFLVFFAVSAFIGIGSANPANAADPENMKCAKETTKTVVHASAVGLSELLKNTKSKQEGIDLIRTFIGSIRFYGDNSGYFYVYDYDCINIAHAVQKDLQGQNFRDYKDSKGHFVIRELSSIAKNGGGFVEFYWAKPGHKDEFRKLGYVESIPGTNYFIGSGVYEE